MEGPRLAENWYLGGARSPARRCVERGVEADLNSDAGKDTAKKAVTVRVVVKKGCPGGRGLCVPRETGEDDSQKDNLEKKEATVWNGLHTSWRMTIYPSFVCANADMSADRTTRVCSYTPSPEIPRKQSHSPMSCSPRADACGGTVEHTRPIRYWPGVSDDTQYRAQEGKAWGHRLGHLQS